MNYLPVHQRRKSITCTMRVFFTALLVASLLLGLIPPPLIEGVATHMTDLTSIQSISSLAQVLPSPSAAKAQAITYESTENTTPGSWSTSSCNAPLVRTVTVADDFTITDVNMGINMEHNTNPGYRHRSSVTLISPNGTSANLIQMSNTTPDFNVNWDVLLDSDSSNALRDGDTDNTSTPYYGDDRIAAPEVSLDVFDGESALGTWTINICGEPSVSSGLGGDGSFNRAKLFFQGTPNNVSGEIRGTVFNDGNNNGANNREPGVANVTVTAYDVDGNVVASTATDANGAYTLSGLTDGASLRIEFTSLPVGYFNSPAGIDADSAVVFASSPGNSVDFGIILPNGCVNGVAVDALLTTYNAAVSCAVITTVPTDERYTFGLMDVSSAAPDAGRVNQTNSTPMFHHDTWKIDQLGNVFGVAIDSDTGDIFTGASTNFSSGMYGGSAILNFGSIGGGGTGNVAAAGTVYKLDATTGAATVFAQLPQRSTTITHNDCENGTDTITRSNVGVGLGNLVYDPNNNQLFVANWEDGRIYRLDMTGTILDTYDPDATDNGSAGFSNGKVPYGLDVNSDSTKLFYGTMSRDIYSIDLMAAGGFNGTSAASGLGYDHYQNATETLHITLPTKGNTSGGGAVQEWTSDLEFLPDGNLLASIRTGCNAFASSYNHDGTTYLVTPDGTGAYNSASQLNISYDSSSESNLFTGSDDYGGVAYDETVGGAINYVVSAGDILAEAGPHGIAVLPSTASGSPLSPLGAIAYFPGSDQSGSDPKGVGGDVQVLNACSAQVLEIGNRVWWDDNLNGVQDPGTAEEPIAGVMLELWLVDIGVTLNPGDALDTVNDATLVATTVTDAVGRYYFSSEYDSATIKVPAGYEPQSWQVGTEVLPNRTYQVRIPDWDGSLGTNAANATAIAANVGAGETLFIAPGPNTGAGSANVKPASDSVATNTIHDANAYDNPGNAAIVVDTGVTGADNHSLDFAFGADISEGTITIIKDAVPDWGQPFAFDGVGVTPTSFQLLDDGGVITTFTNTQTFSGLASGTYTFTEFAQSRFLWELSAITITESTANSSSVIGAIDTSAGPATGDGQAVVNLDAGEAVTVTFRNNGLIHEPVPTYPTTIDGCVLMAETNNDDYRTANASSPIFEIDVVADACLAGYNFSNGLDGPLDYSVALWQDQINDPTFADDRNTFICSVQWDATDNHSTANLADNNRTWTFEMTFDADATNANLNGFYLESGIPGELDGSNNFVPLGLWEMQVHVWIDGVHDQAFTSPTVLGTYDEIMPGNKGDDLPIGYRYEYFDFGNTYQNVDLANKTVTVEVYGWVEINPATGGDPSAQPSMDIFLDDMVLFGAEDAVTGDCGCTEIASLALEKTLISPANGVAMVGDTLTFQLQISNTGSVAVTELNLSDSYDSSILQYITASVTPDVQTAGSLTWVGDYGASAGSLLPNLPLAPGANFTVTVDMETIVPTKP